MSFTPKETAAGRRLVEWALQEDLGSAGDLTSQAVIPPDLSGGADFVAHAPGVLAGLPAVQLVLAAVDSQLKFQAKIEDGTAVKEGDQLASVRGSMRSILAAERTALNFLQHLSGVATRTRKYVDAVTGFRCQILDTRKTTPGWRELEKYAVRCGGGHNHRTGLHDGVFIKDNHLACLGAHGMTITQAITAARQLFGHSVPLIVEIDWLYQLDEALAARPDVVLLDNMRLDELRTAVARRNAEAPGVLLEASGGVNLTTVRDIAATGVDRISVGEVTHSAPALDIGLDYTK